MKWGLIISQNKRSVTEILMALLTGVGKLVFFDLLNQRLLFMAAVIIGWSTYSILRFKQNPGAFTEWGFRTSNTKKVSKMILPFALFGFISTLLCGYLLGTIQITWHVFPMLLFYPIWGTLQQFLIIGIISGNLQNLKGVDIAKWKIILITSSLFAVVHFPYMWLIGSTFLLSGFYTWIYLKERNLYVLGILHGWLGAIFFYAIMERDPFTEVFGFLM